MTDAEDCVQEAFLQWYASEEKATIENPKAFACADNQIQEIDIIVNPEKLRRLPAHHKDDNGSIIGGISMPGDPVG